jgi:formate C-acetyltransferase
MAAGGRTVTPTDIWKQIDFLRQEALREPQIDAAPDPVREGRIFAFTLAHLPLDILAGSHLAGAFGADWSSPTGLGAELGARCNAWSLAEAARRATAPPAAPNPWGLLHERFHCFASSGGDAHTTVNHARVVTLGLDGILAEIERELTGSDTARRDYLLGMQAALGGLKQWATRFASLAEQRAESATVPCEKQRLLGIAARCRRIPAQPARTLLEALQAVWFVQLGIGISERSSASLSLGRLDQYLYPLYEQERADGATVEELGENLADFFRTLNTFGDPACTVNLGPAIGPHSPVAAENRFNPLSRLILDTAKRLRLPSPILAVRIHRDIPPEVFDVFTDPALVDMGQPTFYGEEPCRRALERRGVPADQVPGWAANSCMGLVMPGAEWANMWGSVVTLLLPLELALNHGRPFRHDLPFPLRTAAPESYATFEELFETVGAFTTELVDLCINETETRTRQNGETRPNPFVSALLDDCVRRGQDRLLGGCRYQTVTVESFGLINAADALLAIRTLAFEERRFTLAEMVEAARGDFLVRPDVLRAIMTVAKFGNGDPEADGMARRLSDRFAAAVLRHSHDGVYYAPSFHTLSAHIPAGAKMAASLDGRRAGEPLAKNMGTTPGRAREGHTALIRSAAAIDQAAYFGGQALDLRVDPATLRTQDGRRKFQALLQTYFRLGGLQVQVNGVSAETLRRAMAEPETHRDVLVRKAGFTTRYVGLPPSEQQELITRVEAGL